MADTLAVIISVFIIILTLNYLFSSTNSGNSGNSGNPVDSSNLPPINPNLPQSKPKQSIPRVDKIEGEISKPSRVIL